MIDPNTNKTKQPALLTRRGFLAGTTAATLAAPAVLAADAKEYRVAVIGHTGHGNYGHGLDRVWLEIPGTKIVGVADADKRGLAATVKRLGNPKGFEDYREMLDEVKPELVTVAPRWLDQHHDMVIAAAERGVRGIYLEKPMCRNLTEADEMVAACKKDNVKLAIAFQTLYSPKLKVMREMIDRGDLGQLLELRARGKDDRRGGGEDLWVLGTHMFNLINFFGGDPKHCFATVWQDGRPIEARDVKQGAEGIGPLAGDEVHATYRMADGVTGYFDSVRNTAGRPTRFGLRIYGSRGVLELFDTGPLPDVRFLPDSSWSPGRTGKKWISVSSVGPGKPEPIENRGLHGGNVLAVKDLISAVEEDRQPTANIEQARTATEMIVAVFESQRVGGPVTFPLKNRRNPLTMLS